jgi:SAM-dependent methyltransferase
MKEHEVTVDLNAPSLYAEPTSKYYRLKRRTTYRDVLKHMRTVLDLRENAAVLEVGTGSGFLLEILENLYPHAILHGIEFDPRLVELTRSKVQRAKVVQGNAESFELPVQFDVIISCQVIEHLFRPESMVHRVFYHLKPGGIFIFTTPNQSGLGARIMGKRWHGYRADHVALKTYEQWVDLVESHGFETMYAGSTFFSGVPILNRLPLGPFNWMLLLVFGSIRWKYGESFVGVFQKKK